MNKTILLTLTLIAIYSQILFAQSREGMILSGISDYVTYETKNQVEGEGELIDGKPHGLWEYYLIFDLDIKYKQGNWTNGQKNGVWNNYSLDPPMGYVNNFDLVRSTETWKEGLLYRLKMGQNNLLIIMHDGLGEPYVSEIQRLEEAFEYSYWRTHGKTVTWEFGESVESILSRFIPLIKKELLNSNIESELKFWSLYKKLKLHEKYDSGKLVYQLVQNWEKEVLYSKEIYINELLSEKFVFMDGDPKDVIEYRYYPSGTLKSMKHFKNDTIPIGRWIENNPDGSKKFQGTYSNGKRDGKWKFWDEEGNQQIVKFKDGVEQ